MAISDLFHTMSSFMQACKRHASQVTRRLRSHPSLSKLTAAVAGQKRICGGGGDGGAAFLSRRASIIPFLGNSKGKVTRSEVEEEDGGVWQRTILMGEKCQPVDFSGAIHYDSSGRQLSKPRTPLRTPALSFAFHDDEEGEQETKDEEQVIDLHPDDEEDIDQTGAAAEHCLEFIPVTNQEICFSINSSGKQRD